MSGPKDTLLTCEGPWFMSRGARRRRLRRDPHEREKCGRLADEQSHVGEKLDHALKRPAPIVTAPAAIPFLRKDRRLDPVFPARLNFRMVGFLF